MPWNRAKILAEIDRDRVPRGVESALLDRPDLGLDNLCFTLENDGTTPQKVNALRIILRLLNYRAITEEQVDRALAQIRSHTTDSDDEIGRAACRAAIWYCFVSQAYPQLRLTNVDRRSLLEHALACHPELEAECSSMINEARKGLNDKGQSDEP